MVGVAGPSPDERIESLRPLLDPVRRSLYLYVLGARHPVGRDEAAGAVEISRSLAAFHLDKLVEEGLLEAGFRRLSGRGGPGAGRPAKVYTPADREIHLSLPPRDYELAARLLLAGGGTVPSPTRLRAARRVGRAIGRETISRAKPSDTPRGDRRALVTALKQHGFQPSPGERGFLRLGNCPFDALTKEHRETICPLNLALLRGMADGLGASSFAAIADDPAEGCCVAFRPRNPPA